MTEPELPSDYILILKCPDKRGIVTAVAGALADLDCNIEESSQFGDSDTGHFFMRLHFSSQQETNIDQLRDNFRPLAKRYSMWWEMHPHTYKARMLIMVSKHDHCLSDLLYRWRIGSLPVEITRVVSNHQTCREIVEREGLRFDHLPINKSNKSSRKQPCAK